MIEREKDPQIEKLAGDVFSKMAEIGKPFDKGTDHPEAHIVSPEDAIKELLQIQKD
jgi:hypothetical protein